MRFFTISIVLWLAIIGAPLAGAGAVAAGAVTSPMTSGQLPATASQWRQVAMRDIEAGYLVTLENHPGMYDSANPQFGGRLARAREQGLALADRVTDSGGYIAALQRFNTEIHDGHAGMAPVLPKALAPSERWPGFVAVWRGERMLVYAAEVGGPPPGAQIVSCDGVPVKEMVQRNVFPYIGRSDEPGHWWMFARALFIDRSNPFITLPSACALTIDGKSMDYTLTWRAATSETRQWREASYNGEVLPVGLTQPRPRLYWMAMPSFQPDERQRDAYRAASADVLANRQRYLEADALVIDLRGNEGGSSAWSQEFARAVWGAKEVDQRYAAVGGQTEVWWRASALNTDHVVRMQQELISEKQAAMAEWAGHVAAGMATARLRGDRYFVERGNAATATKEGDVVDAAPTPLRFNRPVYVIVPGQCASACLDALDVFTLFPNTKLIGAPSAVDSNYMEVRQQPLPSGLASVIVPVKMYVNRRRGAGVFYTPSIQVQDATWSTSAFIAVIEADLARRSLQ